MKPHLNCKEQDLHFLVNEKSDLEIPITQFFDKIADKLTSTINFTDDYMLKYSPKNVPNLDQEGLDENETGDMLSDRLERYSIKNVQKMRRLSNDQYLIEESEIGSQH